MVIAPLDRKLPLPDLMQASPRLAIAFDLSCITAAAPCSGSGFLLRRCQAFERIKRRVIGKKDGIVPVLVIRRGFQDLELLKRG